MDENSQPRFGPALNNDEYEDDLKIKPFGIDRRAQLPRTGPGGSVDFRLESRDCGDTDFFSMPNAAVESDNR